MTGGDRGHAGKEPGGTVLDCMIRDSFSLVVHLKT